MKNFFGKKQVQIDVAVEYCAPHWVILIRNPGQKNWSALRSKTKTVNVHNSFGEVVSCFQAIETFESHKDAMQWVKSHLDLDQPTARKDSEIEKFLLKAKSPVTTDFVGAAQ